MNHRDLFHAQKMLKALTGKASSGDAAKSAIGLESGLVNLLETTLRVTGNLLIDFLFSFSVVFFRSRADIW